MVVCLFRLFQQEHRTVVLPGNPQFNAHVHQIRSVEGQTVAPEGALFSRSVYLCQTIFPVRVKALKSNGGPYAAPVEVRAIGEQNRLCLILAHEEIGGMSVRSLIG